MIATLRSLLALRLRSWSACRSSAVLLTVSLSVAFAVPTPSCRAEAEAPGRDEVASPVQMEVGSDAFDPGAAIPSKYTGEGPDVSPPLGWSDAPAGTTQIVLICDDPDAPRAEPWVHWVAYGIDPRARGLAEGQREGFIDGRNSWGTLGYRGPLPPKGHGIHHYRFQVYAVDTAIGPDAGLTKEAVLTAIDGHVLARGELVGTYLRE